MEMEHHRKAERLFTAGEDRKLLDLADGLWPVEGPATRDRAEVARFARVAAWRSGDRPAAHLWQARAISTAAACGAWGSVALSMQPSFFALVDYGALIEAGHVLEEMTGLAELGDPDPPAPTLVSRIIAERGAFLATLQGNWDEAIDLYSTAIALCRPSTRPFMKVRGGLARAQWLAGGSSAEAAAVFADVAEAAQHFPDVRDAALANLEAARANRPEDEVAFELL